MTTEDLLKEAIELIRSHNLKNGDIARESYIQAREFVEKAEKALANNCDNSEKLKLFVWEDVLADYTSGIMFAMAHNIQEARDLIKDSTYSIEAHCYKSNGDTDDRFNHLTLELNKEPIIWTEPVGYALHGGG